MRRAVGAIVATLLPFAGIGAAAAVEDACRPGRGGTVIGCSAEVILDTVDTAITLVSGGGGGGGSSGGSNIRWVPYDRLIIGPDGQPCVTVAYVPEGQTPLDRILDPLLDPNIGAPGGFNNVYETYPPCPETPAPPPGGEVAPESAARIAARYWEEIPLPRPQPRIAPGRAITGRTAYLETRGETTHTYNNSTIRGPLQIVATGTYWVDWGDGDSSGPYHGEGRPWPEGVITHDYVWVGSYDVVVTERWTASWRLGSESGTLRELRTVGRIDDFPVQEIQAVVVRR